MFITIGERGQEDPVTIVELLSPSNKITGGHGRSQYLDKRQRVIFSEAHLVEIDLIRRGRPMPVEGYDGDAPYRHLISRWQTRPEVDLYPFRLQTPIPDVPVPLLEATKMQWFRWVRWWMICTNRITTPITRTTATTRRGRCRPMIANGSTGYYAKKASEAETLRNYHENHRR